MATLKRIVSVALLSAEVLLSALSLVSLVVSPASAQGRANGAGPVVGRGLGPFVFHGDLRALPPADRTAEARLERLLHGPLLPGRGPGAPTGSLAADLVQQLSAPLSSISSPLETFPGMSGGNPPDTNGVIGPNHYIQTINVSYAIWDKAGTQLVAPTSFTTLFAANPATGTPCDNGFTSDPVVLYDPLVDRFILTILAFAGFQPPPAPPRTPIPPFYECIAVSQTGDPVNGGWFKYALLADATNLNDFPKLGVWPDAYYMSANMNGCCGGSTFVRVWALDKSSILGGGALNEQHFDVQSGFNSLLPANMHGAPPASGEPNVFAAIDYNNNNALFLWNFHVDWAVPANSTFGVGGGHTPNNTVTVAPYTHLTASIPQPGTNVVFLDPLGDRANAQAQYRKVGGTESLWVNHPVDTGGNVSGIRWYEVHDPSGAPSLFQQGTWNNGGDGVNRWMGSMAADRFGNMAVGYNVSSSTVSPGIRYAGRLVSDAAGTLGQGEGTLFAGSGNLINCTPESPATTCTGRWGDYSGMSVDPVDDCTFWFTGEYVTGGSNVTGIGSFALPGCDADLSVTKTGPASVTVGSDLAYSISVSNGGPVAAQFVLLTDATPPNTTFVGLTQNTGPAFNCSTPAVGGTGTMTCSIAALANGAAATFTLTVHVIPSATGTIVNTATVSGQEADPNTGNDTASASTFVIESADLGVSKLCKPDSPIAAGGTATCTIVVNNAGPGVARGVVLTDTNVSNGPYTFGTITTTTGSCSTAAGVVTCNLGTLAAGGSATIAVPVTANNAVDINDTATVSSSTPDPNPANNTATGAVHFAGSADLAITKTSAPNPVVAGTNVTYTITVTNNGPSTATNVVAKDTLPAQVSDVVFTPSVGSCIGGIPGNPALPLTCNLGALTNGASATITVTAKVDASTPDGTILVNNAVVGSDTADPNNGNNNATALTTVHASADLAVVKTSDKAVYKPSSVITYMVTVTNAGPSDALAVVVTDNLPTTQQALYQSDTGGCTSNVLPPTILTCNLGTMPVGTSKSFRIYERVNGSRGQVSNTASVGSSTPDPNSANNTSTLIVTVGK